MGWKVKEDLVDEEAQLKMLGDLATKVEASQQELRDAAVRKAEEACEQNRDKNLASMIRTQQGQLVNPLTRFQKHPIR